MKQDSVLTELEQQIYSRQIRIEGFGTEAQQQLKESTVLVSRCGGVGGTAATLLARAGIGRLLIAHGGKIVPEYLNRQLLAYPENIGQPCAEVFAERLKRINPNVEVIPTNENITENNVVDLVKQADLIVDGAPLFEERYLMNREAVLQKKPMVMAAMFSMENYVTTIIPYETACLNCIYPTPPPYWKDVHIFPAIGPGPITVASIAAMEAIKVLTNYGQTLKNEMLYFDLTTNLFRRLKVNRRTDCPICSNG